jgi:DNA-binding beta-propeller fold protein YncE
LFSFPSSLVVDPSGNLYVVNTGSDTIRMINFNANSVMTIAGTATSFNDGIGSSAAFNSLTGITIDSTGSTIFVSDVANKRIRKVTCSSGTSFYIS